MNELRKIRNINIDVIKCIAVFLVVSVHFSLYNGFYQTPVSCPRMYIMTAIRTFSMMCVPLFLLITGFLMYKKEFSAKFYMGLKRIIIPYIIISVITLVVRVLLHPYGFFDDINYINGFIDFKLSGYAWYVDMYIGLFLLIPFINKMFSDFKKDTFIVSTLIFLTVLPSISTNPTFILGEWGGIWPIMYYAVGAYVAKYNSKINRKWLSLLFIFFFVGFTVLNCILSHNCPWNAHSLDEWWGIENFLTSVLFFICVLNIKFNLPEKIKGVISYIANLSLGIFLFSFIFDNIFYHYLNANISDVTAKLNWYIVIVPAVFVSSVILAIVSDFIYKIIDKGLLKNKV